MTIKLESKDFFDDIEWADKNYLELRKKYSDQWIAVVDRKVVSCGKNLENVKEEAIKKTGRKEVALVFVECGSHIYYD
ncbi:MAG: hypothetical protein HYW26_03875 [Candidatus Aenigmarchaeota archaeon]|nr:hypothetical protein [Candidatus Aenigmarchaeota archaeon]